MNNPSPCLRIRTSLTSAGKRNSCGSRTAWLAPFRNIDALLATAVDMDLAVAFDVTDLFLPVRARFIMYPSVQSSLAYASHMPRICLANGDIKMHSLVAPTHFRIDRRGHGVAVGGHVVPFSPDAPNLIWLRVNHTGPCRMAELRFLRVFL